MSSSWYMGMFTNLEDSESYTFEIFVKTLLCKNGLSFTLFSAPLPSLENEDEAENYKTLFMTLSFW